MWDVEYIKIHIDAAGKQYTAFMSLRFSLIFTEFGAASQAHI